jgi:hypothetical protein
MFGFIDSASEHAVALLNFHHYACFFLLLVICFVVWLLKMVLKFAVLERNLLGVSGSNASSYNLFLSSFNLFFVSVLFFFVFFVRNLSHSVFNFFLDLYYIVMVTFRSRKVRSSYGIHKTLYPDLGIYIDSFRALPVLLPVKNEFRRPFTSQLFTLFSVKRSKLTTLSLKIFRNSLYQVPALFPYERIRIPCYGPWRNVETMITLTTFFISYIGAIKYGFWSSLDNGRLAAGNESLLSNSGRFNLSLFLKKNKFSVLNMSPAILVGSSPVNSSSESKDFFKGYSSYLSVFYYFSKFCSSESRMFFYLFFQNVRHRKVLEWV